MSTQSYLMQQRSVRFDTLCECVRCTQPLYLFLISGASSDPYLSFISLMRRDIRPDKARAYPIRVRLHSALKIGVRGTFCARLTLF